MVTLDLTRKYRPHRGQVPFHRDAGIVKFRLLSGGTGSGKTAAGIYEDVAWALRYPGIVGYVFEPTYPMIERNVIPTLDWLFGVPFWEFPAVEAFNRTRMNIRFTNGSVLWLVSLDRPESAEGANVDFAHVDEARLVQPEAQWEVAWRVIQRRLRGSGIGDFPIGAWITTTPNAPGSALYNFFENPKTKLSFPQARVYRMHLDDNRENLEEWYIENVKRGHGEPGDALYRRFVEGLFAADDVATFPFDYTVHVEGYVEPEFGDVAYGVDFGWTDPSSIVAVKFDGDRRAYVLDEFYGSKMSDSDMAERCFDMIERWGVGQFWCDPSSPDTIDYLRGSGVRAMAGNRNRDEGIRAIGGRLRDAGDGRHRLYVSPKCVNLIDELQIYSDSRKGHDHAVDALRYCLMGASRGPGERSFEFGPPLGWTVTR